MAREPKDPSDVPSIDSPARPASMLTRPPLRRPDRSSDQDDLASAQGQARPVNHPRFRSNANATAASSVLLHSGDDIRRQPLKERKAALKWVQPSGAKN